MVTPMLASKLTRTTSDRNLDLYFALVVER